MRAINRRLFMEKAGLTTLASQFAEAQEGRVAVRSKGNKPEARGAPGPTRFGMQRCVTEWSFTSGKVYPDPINDVELDVIFTSPQGVDHRVPAFWAGEQTWRVRYSPAAPGRYAYRTVSSDPSNTDLHAQRGVLEAAPYTGENALRKHGPVRVSSDHAHFEHEDGTPFFWLGDTWWMGLCRRLRWPEDVQTLAADRVRKGFTVIQIVAGLYPDMPPFDPRGANEAGFPWEPNYARISPHYFDMADLRIQYLVDQGLMPCIVGCWGYFLPWMGMTKMKQHWRNLIARWGAYPVVWCLAGEGTMPYYLSKTKSEDEISQKRGWTEMARYVRATDPNHHLITIHPGRSARDSVEDPTVLDFDMLQTGHNDRASIPRTVDSVAGELSRAPRMPVLVGEVCYEGILEASRQEVQRFMFWACMLSGAAGHTYGANGIWQVNTDAEPFGPSPHGRCWGNTPWNVAYRLPGSGHVGIGKSLLTRYPWWRFEPHPEWVQPRWTKENYILPYAAGIPGEVRVVFIPPAADPPKVVGLEPGVAYTSFYFDPVMGKQHEMGKVQADAAGTWQPPVQPTFADWVLALERKA